MPTLRSSAGTTTNRKSLALLLASVMLASAFSVAAAQDRPRGGGQPPADHGQSDPRQGEQRQAQAQGPAGEQRQAPPGPGVLRLLPGDAVTQHSIEIAGRKLDYTATAGTFSLFDQSGERSAAIYYTAYVAKDADAASRPLTFVFNGGPGAASAFLNLGLVGPRVAQFALSGHDGAQTKLMDNPDSWLAFTDLVLIDPVGSGWSRPAKPDGGSAFWGVRRDADSMAKVIALYVNNNVRSASPKYILGESYGGFRAAKVGRAVQEQQGIIISGIVMLSPLLDGGLTFGGTRHALGAALQLPSLAAAELERKGTFSPDKLAAAERFALTEYLSTLAGAPPQGEAAHAFYARVAAMTGLPEDVVAKTRGFIRDSYVKNSDSGERKVVSHYDATFAVDDPYPDQVTNRGPDPLLDGVVRAYGGAYAAYARDELGFKTEMTYNLLASEVSGKWDWEGGGRGSADVSDDLRTLLALTPSFRLLIAHGYSDMVTPFAASRYVLNHLPQLDDPTRAQLRLYRGGHMLYLDPASRHAFSTDAKAFYQEAP
ncbi:MAG TPA: carboxypeptidase [Xanthobacteraceae bacterium]